MTITHILEKLRGVRRGPNGYTAKCPAHEDNKQSLSIHRTDGKVLLNCFAGCDPTKIIESVGLEWKDLFDGSKPSHLTKRSLQTTEPNVRIVTRAKAKVAGVYRYTDESGELLYENVRLEPKGFAYRRYDERGNAVWDLSGVSRVPYRLPDLVSRVTAGSDVWLTEGEKDADTLAELGFTATSFKNWSRSFNKYIDKTNVILVRDHDIPGGVQANEAARLIAGASRSLKVLDVHAEYEMPEKHGRDISDYVEQCVRDEGMTREEIAERIALMADGSNRWVDSSLSTANLFIVKSGNQWLEEAKKRPAPKMLFGEFWFQGELCILFADTNVGKSILAVQMGEAIARGCTSPHVSKGDTSDVSVSPSLTVGLVHLDSQCSPQKVVYFDFELTDKQFESRVARRDVVGDYYTDHYQFSEKFSRAEIDPETSELHGFKNFEEFLNHSLDKTIVDENADVLIIDNLTYLRDETENARNALPLMKYLKELKSRHGISILALAHTPKRDAAKPLGRNDLQGSKMIINFCDSSFAIGESQKEQGVRYLKQIKARNSALVYHGENVLLANIEKVGSLLRFVFKGTGSEREHLKSNVDKERMQVMERCRELSEAGKTVREIADEVGVSYPTVSRYLKAMKEEA